MAAATANQFPFKVEHILDPVLKDTKYSLEGYKNITKRLKCFTIKKNVCKKSILNEETVLVQSVSRETPLGYRCMIQTFNLV